MACLYMSAQKVTSYSTTQEQSWKKAQTALSGKARGKVVADVKEQSKGIRFVAFGTTFNEYYNWNFILKDNGISPWGWTQNALIQVDGKPRKMRYTAEYCAYKHFRHFVQEGSEMLAYDGREYSKTPVVVFRDKRGQYIVTMGNFTDAEASLTVKVGKKYLNVQAKLHSFNTYIWK